MINKKLEKLNEEIEKTEEKLRKVQQREKMLKRQANMLTRKERTHRLCTRGAMLESYLPHPETVTDEQVSTILKVLFHKGDNRQLMERILTGNQEEENHGKSTHEND